MLSRNTNLDVVSLDCSSKQQSSSPPPRPCRVSLPIHEPNAQSSGRNQSSTWTVLPVGTMSVVVDVSLNGFVLGLSSTMKPSSMLKSTSLHSPK